jgi:Brp/Blh family beta-carotene 15,15'-monooxygenase
MSDWNIIAIAAILLFGVPHGGLDGAIARRVGWPEGIVSWLSFHLAYIVLTALVVVIWWLFPLFSMVIFLLISGIHFGASDIADTGNDWLPWIAHSGLVCIAIPSLQAVLVEPIFGILIGEDNASLLMGGITVLFLPWVFCVLGYFVYAYFTPNYRKPLLHLLVLTGLASLLPPLIIFSLYFCLWHSRGHMLRLWRSLAKIERRRSLLEATIYTVIAWLSLAIIFYYLQGSAAALIVQLTFIGLAALTLPHMLLVDYADRHHYQRESQS